MAEGRFVNKDEGIDVIKRFQAPKTSSMQHWFREARKYIPQIPNPKNSDWSITHEFASATTIIYEMHNSIGQKCALTIDRMKQGFGARD